MLQLWYALNWLTQKIKILYRNSNVITTKPEWTQILTFLKFYSWQRIILFSLFSLTTTLKTHLFHFKLGNFSCNLVGLIIDDYFVSSRDDYFSYRLKLESVLTLCSKRTSVTRHTTFFEALNRICIFTYDLWVYREKLNRWRLCSLFFFVFDFWFQFDSNRRLIEIA